MQNFAVHISRLGALLLLTALSTNANAQDTHSYFGTSSPVQSVVPVTTTPPVSASPAQSPSVPIPASPIALATKPLEEGPPTTSMSPESMEIARLDQAVGLPVDLTQGSSLRTKFAAFLQPHPTATVYAQQLGSVRLLLQNHRTLDAFHSLQAAATTAGAIDGNASHNLTVWVSSALTLRENLRQRQNLEEQIRRAAVAARANADVLAAGNAAPAPAPPTHAPSGRPAPAKIFVLTEHAEIQKKLRLKIEELDASEAARKIERIHAEAKAATAGVDARFTELLTGLLGEHKYEQITLALPFYRQVLGTEICPPGAVEKTAEAQRQILQTDALVTLAAGKARAGELVAATAALFKAYTDGEYQPGLLSLDPAIQNRVKAFMSAAEALRRRLQTRDFDSPEACAGDLRGVTADFDPAKLLALLRTYQLESNFHVGNAARAVGEKNPEAASEQWLLARKAWRHNPALEAFPDSIRPTGNISQQKAKFDQLLAAQNLRAICARRLIFEDLLSEDAARLGQLRKAVDAGRRLEIATAKIDTTRKAGDINGAWELAEAAEQEWPDDPAVRDCFTRLSGEAAAYADAIKRARQAETRQQYGYSLMWYVAAQRLYPVSVQTRQALTRVQTEATASLAAGDFVVVSAWNVAAPDKR